MERRSSMQRRKLLKILRRWKVLFIRKQQSIYLGLLDISITKLYLIYQWKYLVQSRIFFSNVKNKRRFMSILRNVFTWRCHRSCHNPEKSNIRQPITCVCHMLSTWSFCLTPLTFLVEQNIVHIINLNENQLVCSIGYFSILHRWKICNQMIYASRNWKRKHWLIGIACIKRFIRYVKHHLWYTSLQYGADTKRNVAAPPPLIFHISYIGALTNILHINYSLQRLCTYYVR